MSGPGPRQERGSAEGSRRHPPHLETNTADAPVQRSAQAPNAVPTQAANAGGSDKQPVEEAQKVKIDRASMYERRPEEHKDHHPER
jgi:hypothetical protein